MKKRPPPPAAQPPFEHDGARYVQVPEVDAGCTGCAVNEAYGGSSPPDEELLDLTCGRCHGYDNRIWITGIRADVAYVIWLKEQGGGDAKA